MYWEGADHEERTQKLCRQDPPHPDLAIGWSWFMSFRVKLSLYV